MPLYRYSVYELHLGLDGAWYTGARKGERTYRELLNNGREEYYDTSRKEKYIFGGIANYDPVITFYDSTLGDRTKDFTFRYSVHDPDGDPVSLKIYLDGKIFKEIRTIRQSTTFSIDIPASTMDYGTHTIKFVATDTKNDLETIESVSFDKVNSPPVITGSSTDLGHQNNDFSITYRVSDEDNDEVKVDVMVDGKVIQYPMAKALNQSHSVPIRIKDYGLGDHTITVTATDTNNASASRTYYFTKSNTAPSISGSDMDLGAKFEDFQVDYLVQDAEGNDVSVEIKVDGAIKQSSSKSTLGVRRYFTIPIKDYEIGRHTIEIKATDSNGASTVRAYTFNKVNSAPAISGQDENLGAKNTAFSYTYTVTDRESDTIDVIEKVNGEVIRVLNNATLGSEYRITITDEQIRKLELNASNTIEIEATDGTATSFRRVTFIRNNMPPIIADRDKDLGEVTNSFEYSWSATDPEKDKMTAVVYLDDRILKDRHAISDGANQTIKIDGMDMFKISRGKHTIRIVVEDDKGFNSTRTLTFTRVVNRLVMKLAGNGIETDGLAKRVLISTAGIHVAKGADVKYEVCNNSFDDSPTWEDATAMTMANKAFNFTNKDKVAEKAGVDIKVTITRGDAKGQSYISAIGGSFD